ncbi:MAG: type I-Fv CRISPR-associated protein Cas5fv [Methylotenera sp.]|nr:type I-Fv CRISPR-associated protein Cas5fv [Methylotenera sp.]
MRITIKYEASWRNSFLDGSNNEPLPKGGRGFVGSMTNLSKRENDQYANFINRDISIDTVMGVLNRLIGDQRKLYQSRSAENYFFSEIENKITFQDTQDKEKPINKEMVYIRNVTGSTDQNSFTGMIKGDDPIFSSLYSDALWGVLTLAFSDLCAFISDDTFVVNNTLKFDPLSVLTQLEQLNKLKPVEVVAEVEKALSKLNHHFPEAEYLDTKGMIKPIMFYCSALYLQIARLSQRFNLIEVLTKSGGISGISKRGFTPKDFMDKFTTGSKKPIWGNPFILKERRKGEGEITHMLTKANGTLEINLDIPLEKAQQLKDMIEAAGVSSFYLGKKGLAYVDGSIRL